MLTVLKIKPEERKEVRIPIGKITLSGHLVIPEDATAIVIFSHGSSSNRFSPRNNYVATELNKEKMATLLIDLLTSEEGLIYANRFDIDLLKYRLVQVTKWVKSFPGFEHFSIGYFGASTGAASALKAAAELKDDIAAIVSRGGRPDLAEPFLYKVEAPTLLIVGSLDTDVIHLNHLVFERLHCEKKLEFVEDATHLFKEPGTLEEVAILTAQWFKKYLINNKLLIIPSKISM